jgi:steroid 5-alpha reductase family enzyme
MPGIAWGPLGLNLAATAGALLALMTAVFGYGLARDRHRAIDAVWGAAFALVAAIGLLLAAGNGDVGRRLLLTGLTVVWGLRLAIHIGLRGRGAPEDPRYEAFLSKARGNRTWFAFTRIYLLQGFLVWFVSLPVQFGQYATGAGNRLASAATVTVGCALWILGFAFETVGDWQLSRFKADPANRGRLMRTGLRRYTRHPNYFGDACVWWGLFLIAASTWSVLLTIPSPVVMTWLLTRGSGKPLLEARLARTRPDFADYAATTSGFLPRRPRR